MVARKGQRQTEPLSFGVCVATPLFGTTTQAARPRRIGVLPLWLCDENNLWHLQAQGITNQTSRYCNAAAQCVCSRYANKRKSDSKPPSSICCIDCLRGYDLSQTEFGNLWVLRSPGRNRAFYGRPSISMQNLQITLKPRSLVVDFGCGDSGDRCLLAKDGHRAIGLDLFPPTHQYGLPKNRRNQPEFVLADMRHPLPFRQSSIDGAICHAMIDLLRHEEREFFYKECFRVLRKGAKLALSGVNLKHGFGFIELEERVRCCQSGFTYRGPGVFQKV